MMRVNMKSQSLWLKWTATLGAASFLIGLAWLVLWSYTVHRGEPAGSIAYELHAPIQPRLMVLAGILALIVAGVSVLVEKLVGKSSVSR